jgi:hypothetical protein
MSRLPANWKRPVPISWGQGHGRAVEARRGAGAVQGAEARRPTCRSISTPMTRRASRRRRCWPRWRAASTRSMRRWMRCRATPRSPASARSSRRCAAPPRDPGLDAEWIRAISAYWEACAPSMRPSKRPEGAGLGSLSARDAGRAVHQSEGAGALDGAGRPAGTRSPGPMPMSTMRCSATSSRSRQSSKVVGDMALMMVSQD